MECGFPHAGRAGRGALTGAVRAGAHAAQRRGRAGGKRMDLADRWAEMQLMARMARELFAQCAAAPA